MTQQPDQAYDYLEQGLFREAMPTGGGYAIAYFEQLIASDPDHLSNYWYLGLAWLLAGDEVQAQTIWLSAFANPNLTIDETATTELLTLLKEKGQFYLSSCKPELAERIYRVLLEWDNSQADIYYYLGQAIALQGKLEEAIDYWQNSIEINPNYRETYLHQAEVYQKLEEFESASLSYQKAIELSPDYFSYYQLGFCLTQLERWEEANASFQQSIQLQPDFASSYSELGIALIYQGCFDEAVTALQTAIQLQPDFAQSLIQNRSLSSQNLHPSGLKLLQQLLQSSSLQISLYLGQILSKINPQISIALFHQACIESDQKSDAYLELGKILLQQNRVEEAIQAYQMASYLNRDDANIYLELGKAKVRLEQWEDGISDFKIAIELNKTLSEAYQALGKALFQTGRVEEAIATFKKQLELEPKSSLTLALLGFILGQNNQIEEGIFDFQKALECNSSVSPLIFSLVTHLCEQKHLNPNHPNFSTIYPVNPPQSFYESTQDWLQTQAFNPSNYDQIFPEITINLIPPKSLDQTLHFSFRFGHQIQLPASFVVEINNGRFWLSFDQTQTAIITPDQHFIGDLSPDYPILSPQHPNKHPSNHAILSLEKLPPLHQVQGTVAVLAGLSNPVYFHWMLDILPRIELLKRSGFSWDEIDYFVISDHLPFQKETLNLLKIPEHQRIDPTKFSHIQAEKLIVPSFPGTVAWMPKWTCDFLKNQILRPQLSSSLSGNKRIYISRNNAKSRRILNEDELINFLEPYGFERIILESLSVVEQAELFSQAKLIIAPHGSGLTNLVFCQPGTQVIELFSPNYIYHCYWWISNLVGLDYYYLLGETFPGHLLQRYIYPNNFSEDIWIDLKKLLDLLKRADMSL